MTNSHSLLLDNVPFLTARSLGFAFAGKEEHKKQRYDGRQRCRLVSLLTRGLGFALRARSKLCLM